MTMLQDIQAGSIPGRLTVADVYTLQTAGLIDEREHFELVGGEIVPMAAANRSREPTGAYGSSGLVTRSSLC